MTLDEIELNQKERLVRDYILPILPNESYKYDNLNEWEIKRAKSILAQEYVEHGRIRDPALLILLILTYDYLFILEPIVYGLIISIYGSLLAVIGDIHTPESLADETLGANDRKEEEIRSKAEESIRVNIIAVSLAIGFSGQILAVIGFFGTELISANIFVGDYPSWIGGVIAFVLFWSYQQISTVLEYFKRVS